MKITFEPFPTLVGLSLSNICNAKCIWCVIGCGIYKPRKNRFMSMEIIEKIVKECMGKNVLEFWFSENGEGLMHPRFKEIVIRMRNAFPTTPFGIASNLFLVDEDMARFILRSGFFFIGCNLDGLSQEAYGAVKGLPVEKAKENLLRLLALRNEISPNCGIHVNILTEPSYYLAINEPEKITVRDESLDVFHWLLSHLEWTKMDTIFNPFPLTWAVREEWKKPKTRDVCLGLPSIGCKLFVDTDGGVYPCCQDYDSDYTFGNVLEQGITEIWRGERRKLFVENLLKHNYSAIGKPCMYCAD